MCKSFLHFVAVVVSVAAEASPGRHQPMVEEAKPTLAVCLSGAARALATSAAACSRSAIACTECTSCADALASGLALGCLPFPRGHD